MSLSTRVRRAMTIPAVWLPSRTRVAGRRWLRVEADLGQLVVGVVELRPRAPIRLNQTMRGWFTYFEPRALNSQIAAS